MADLGTALSAAQTLFAALDCSLIKEAYSVSKYKSELERLKETVTTVKSVLVDAGKKAVLSQADMNYIQKLKDAVIDANDLLGKFLTIAARKQNDNLSDKVRHFFSTENPIKFALEIFKDVKKIRSRLDAIADDRTKFDIHEAKDFEEDEERIKEYPELMKKAKIIKRQIRESHSQKVKNKQILDHQQVQQWVFSTLINGKPLLKWLIIVLNVIIELIQAVLAQEASEGLINKSNYARLCVISSSICLIMSIFDIFVEAKEGGVTWRRKGIWVWLYYPGKHGRMFGNFWIMFGLLSSTVQFFVNLGGYLSKKPGFVRFDYLPLLLAVSCLIAAFGNGKRSMLGVVKCNEKHEEHEIEGKFVHGNWVFECPICKMESFV